MPPLRLPERESQPPSLEKNYSSLEIFESASLAAKVVCDAHRKHLSVLMHFMETLTTGAAVQFSIAPSLDSLDANDVIALTTLLLSLPPETFSPPTYGSIQSAYETAISAVQQIKGESFDIIIFLLVKIVFT